MIPGKLYFSTNIPDLPSFRTDLQSHKPGERRDQEFSWSGKGQEIDWTREEWSPNDAGRDRGRSPGRETFLEGKSGLPPLEITVTTPWHLCRCLLCGMCHARCFNHPSKLLSPLYRGNWGSGRKVITSKRKFPDLTKNNHVVFIYFIPRLDPCRPYAWISRILLHFQDIQPVPNFIESESALKLGPLSPPGVSPRRCTCWNTVGP